MGSDGASSLSPFFAKSDALLLIDRKEGIRRFLRNEQRKAETLCDMILKSGVDQLVCGFIGEPERRTLRAAGIDVRLSSCTRSVDELATCSYDLPTA